MKRTTWLGAFAAYKLYVLGLGFACIALVPKIWPQSLQHFCLILYQWDARNFLNVARGGYRSFEPSMQIFPIYPWLIRLFQLAIPSWEIAGVVAANVASFFSFYYLYRLARLELDEQSSKIALVLFAIFPTAFFLSAPYSEAIFCALSFGAVYHVRVKNYPAAAALGFLAAATRYTGFLLAPALFVQWIAYRKTYSKKQTLWLGLVAVATVLGFALYLGLNKYYYDDWFYYMDMQAKHWGNRMSYPFSGAVAGILGWASRSPDQRISIIIVEIAFMLLACAMLVPVYLRGRKTRQMLDFAYMALNLALLSLLAFWLSRPRYVLTLYPMFLVAAPWFKGSPLRLGFYGLVSASLFGIYWAIYLNAQWAH